MQEPAEVTLRKIQEAYWNKELDWFRFGERVGAILILAGLDRRNDPGGTDG